MMYKTVITIAFTALASIISLSAYGQQDGQVVMNNQGASSIGGDVAVAAPSQDYCIGMMADFPDDSHTSRYQFFRLTQDMAVDASPTFQSALERFGDPSITPGTPILESIEAIANPVLRQAAPEMVIAYMADIIDFYDRCNPYILGQIDSLRAYDPDLSLEDYVIGEDSLFLRQVLSDSLFRVNADSDSVYGPEVQRYAHSLVITRDHIEFQSFNSDIDELEMMYMTDLDGRLARSNDMINQEMDMEILGNAVTLSDDMNEALQKKHDEETILTLMRILSRY